MNYSEEQQTALIPRNFIERGTFMGGMFKIRNAIEGIVLAVAIAVPVLYLPLSMTVRIIILCMTALPAAMVALIGIGGESLTAFAMNALRFLKNRRILYRLDTKPEPKGKKKVPKPRAKEPKSKKGKRKKEPSSPGKGASAPSSLEKTETVPPEEKQPVKKKSAGSMTLPPNAASKSRPARISASWPTKKSWHKKNRLNP